jgi:LmbE family N-acetylglucosaminyl deacetylase
MPPLRLMGVFAHPDDESLGFGSTLARYAAEGVETYVLTATGGERGRFRGIRPGEAGHPGTAEVTRVREAELRAAAEALGVRELTLLGYHDGDLDRADPREAVARIAQHVRRVRPQVLVTFAPDGAYGHPDHIAICQFTTAAAIAAADGDHAGEGPRLAPHAVSKLYYMAWPKSTMSAYEQAFHRVTSTVDGLERQSVAWPDWAITTAIDARAHLDAVWRAISCHDSQVAAYRPLMELPIEQREAIWGTQSFYRAFSAVNGGRERETDLFEGLREARVDAVAKT